MCEVNGQHYLPSVDGKPSDSFGLILQKPKFPQYAVVSKRQESFKTWPEYHPLKPDCFVEAGLVYTGVGDSVRCYHCGGGLRNWESVDIPWEEHAKWYPTCPRVLLVKGQSYVDAIGRGENPEENKEVVSGDINTVAAQSCLQMGYSEKHVTEAIAIFTRKYDNSNFKGVDLLEIIFDIEDGMDGLSVGEDATQYHTGIKEEADPLYGPCVLCSDSTADTVCLPCGHLVCCAKCVLDLNTCPVCDNAVKGYFKTYAGERDETGLPSKDSVMDQEYGTDDDEDSVKVKFHRSWWKTRFSAYLSLKFFRTICCWCCQTEEEDAKRLV